jgi:hypothetical protein
MLRDEIMVRDDNAPAEQSNLFLNIFMVPGNAFKFLIGLTIPKEERP